MKLKTRIRSTGMRLLASPWLLERQRARARRQRRARGTPATVRFFHQVDDPYSHLAIHKLDSLVAAYRVDFEAHLVPGPAPAFQGSTEHFGAWALRDATSVAADYGIDFQADAYPDARRVCTANAILAGELEMPGFVEAAIKIGRALWSDGTLENTLDTERASRALDAGTRLRHSLGHYLGGMFEYDGEWFWGIDRIRSLEQRLQAEGLAREAGTLCVPEPTPINTSGMAAGHLRLEYFPSLRSPYTAIGHQRVLDLVARSGVTLDLRPVMPMMMRGVSAPRAKQRYIIQDAAREARTRGVPFGNFVDPFGEPVRRAFALYPGAVSLGRGMEFVTEYLVAAWAEGIDITGNRGLRRVAERAGLDWDTLVEASAGQDWQGLLETNVGEMLSAGLWGVPSFRVSGGEGPSFACWGQDRIWRVENEIARRCSNSSGPG